MDKRDFKTHPQQWITIVDFGEEHPTIFRPQFKHGDGDARQNEELWVKLTEILNSMGFGFRSVDKWKMAIGRWKSKTKSKAAQLRIEAEKTGAGPSKAVPLTETEERLMKLMGWKAVTGDGSAELEMGPVATHLPLPQQKHLAGQPQASSSAEIERPAYSTKSPPPLLSFSGPARQFSLQPPEPQPSGKVETEGPAYVSKSPPFRSPSRPSSGPTRKRSRLSNEKSRKFVSLSKMHQEAMEERKKLTEYARRQAEAQEAKAQTLQDFVAYFKMKE